ncbi:MAG: DUF4124 domain-containing protein [Burkholderiales bacterium]
MNRAALTIALLTACAAFSAHAQQYRWVDEKGKTHYTDTPPPPSAKGIQKKSLGGRGGTGEAAVPYDLQRAMSESPVTLYTHPSCTDSCQVARSVLNRRGVPFKEVSVTTLQGMEDLKQVSGGSEVPVMVVGKQVEKGIGIEIYNAALDAAGYPREGLLAPRKQAAPAAPKPEELETEGSRPKPAPAAEPEPPQKRGPYSPR